MSADDDRLSAFGGAQVQGAGLGSAPYRATRSLRAILLQQHQRQPQREQRAHDDHAREAHRAEGLLLYVGPAAPLLPIFTVSRDRTSMWEDPTYSRIRDVVEEGSSQEAPEADPGP